MTRRRLSLLLVLAIVGFAIVNLRRDDASPEYEVISRYAGRFSAIPFEDVVEDVAVPQDLADAFAALGIDSAPPEPGLFAKLLAKLDIRPLPAMRFAAVSPGSIHALPDGRIVVVSYSTLITIPGAPSLALDLVSRDGRVVRTGPFDIGWREHSAEVLAALTWLGGVHVNLGPPWPGTYHEDHESVRIWHDLLADDAVRLRLEALARSEEPWVREAARLATVKETYPR